MKLIEGQIEPVSELDDELGDLREENRQLRTELSRARSELAQVKRATNDGLGALRRQLSPLYRALQQVFGELDAAGTEEATASTSNPRVAAIWENWKSKMPGYPARIIDALLLQSGLNTTQLAIACGCKPRRISEGIMRLHRAGLIGNNILD